MKIFSISPIFFEQWDFRQCASGIGGSEQNATELAWRLARRGHDVTVFAPIPDDCPTEWRGTKWRNLEEADFSEPGLWLLYRCPELLDAFHGSPDQRLWLIAQDEGYKDRMTEERAVKLEKYLAYCPAHMEYTKQIHPFLGDKLTLTSNGIKVDLMQELEKEGIPERNPKKIMYASSPDRGLPALIEIFTRAREWVPDLELHVFYGFNNIEKLIQYDKKFDGYKQYREQVLKMLERPGITHHGRVSQSELYREWMTAGIWCYPTEFGETSCITCMEAQALGAIPIFNPYWALKDNVQHGIAIDGWPYRDLLTQARFVGEIVSLIGQPDLQKKIREPMMREARMRFDWERWVSQFCDWIDGTPQTLQGYAAHANGEMNADL